MNKSRVTDSSCNSSRKAEQELIDLKTRFAEYQKDNRKLRQKNEQMSKDMQSLQDMNETLTRENANLVKQNKQVQDACKKLESKMTHGMTKCNLVKLEAAVNKLKEKNHQQSSQIEQLEELTKKQAKEIQVLNKTWEEKFSGDEDIERLVYELNTLRIENEEYSTTVQQQNYKLEAMDQELLETTQERDSIRMKCDTLTSELETKSKMLQELQDQFHCLQSERDDALEEKETLLQVIEDNTQELTRSRSQCEQLSVENAQLREQAHTMHNQLEVLNTELTSTRERFGEINQMLLLKESQLNEECQRRVYFQQMESELRVYLQQVEMKNAELSHQLDVFNELNLNCQDRICESDRDKTTLNEQIRNLQFRIKELQADLDTIESRRDVTESEIRETLEATNQELNEVKESRDDIHNQFTHISAELEQTRDKLEKLQIDHSSLLEKHTKLEEGKRLVQQTLMDQLSNERDQTKQRDQTIEELNSIISLLRDEKSALHETLESHKRAKEIARSKKKILKQAKQKVHVLDESRLSQDNKENVSFVSTSTSASISKLTQKQQSFQSLQTSFLSSANLNTSELNNSNINKSYSSVGCDDHQRSSLDISGNDSLPLSTNQMNRSGVLNTSLLNTSIQSGNSSILYPTPTTLPLASNQNRFGGVVPRNNTFQPTSLPVPHVGSRYVSTNGHPMNLFELAGITRAPSFSAFGNNGVHTDVQRGIPNVHFNQLNLSNQ